MIVERFAHENSSLSAFNAFDALNICILGPNLYLLIVTAVKLMNRVKVEIKSTFDWIFSEQNFF